jgi:hypothetical protein
MIHTYIIHDTVYSLQYQYQYDIVLVATTTNYQKPKMNDFVVELGLCLCSRLPGKVDNQTEVTRGQSQ